MTGPLCTKSALPSPQPLIQTGPARAAGLRPPSFHPRLPHGLTGAATPLGRVPCCSSHAAIALARKTRRRGRHWGSATADPWGRLPALGTAPGTQLPHPHASLKARLMEGTRARSPSGRAPPGHLLPGEPERVHVGTDACLPSAALCCRDCVPGWMLCDQGPPSHRWFGVGAGDTGRWPSAKQF